MLRDFHGQQAVVLIDEHDNPIVRGYTAGWREEVTSFMRSWLTAALKDTDSLFLATLTGVQRVAKELVVRARRTAGSAGRLRDLYEAVASGDLARRGKASGVGSGTHERGHLAPRRRACDLGQRRRHRLLERVANVPARGGGRVQTRVRDGY